MTGSKQEPSIESLYSLILEIEKGVKNITELKHRGLLLPCIKSRLKRLRKYGLVEKDSLKITPKGKDFITRYSDFKNGTDRLEMKYFGTYDDDRIRAIIPVDEYHELIDLKQVNEAKKAIIEELEKK